MQPIIDLLESINERAGKAVSWLATVLVFVICLDVLCRYLFDFTVIWITELEIYFFALIFLIGAGYAFKHDRHVRVDLFYAKLPEKKKAWINLLGGLFFLLPWTAIIFWVTYNYAYMSFLIGERSPQPGGLPALYLLKFAMTAGFLLLFLQGIASVLRSIQIIRA